MQTLKKNYLEIQNVLNSLSLFQSILNVNDSDILDIANVQYPCAVVYYSGAAITENIFERQFAVKFIDVQKQNEADKNSIISAMELAASNFINKLKVIDSNNNYTFSNVQPLEQYTLDYTAGVEFSITARVPSGDSLCANNCNDVLCDNGRVINSALGFSDFLFTINNNSVIATDITIASYNNSIASYLNKADIIANGGSVEYKFNGGYWQQFTSLINLDFITLDTGLYPIEFKVTFADGSVLFGFVMMYWDGDFYLDNNSNALGFNLSSTILPCSNYPNYFSSINVGYEPASSDNCAGLQLEIRHNNNIIKESTLLSTLDLNNGFNYNTLSVNGLSQLSGIGAHTIKHIYVYEGSNYTQPLINSFLYNIECNNNNN